MGNKTQSLSLSLKNTGSKIALGAASVMAIAAIGSSTIVGATPGTDKSEDKAKTSQHKDNNNEGNHNGQHKNGNNGNHNGQGHGYGGDNNSVETGITVNQNGHDNVFTLIFNYFFG